jgi:glutaredoxin
MIVYTKPGCPYCAALKRDLDARGVDYEEIDVFAVPGAAEKVEQLTGARVVPVVVDGDVVQAAPEGG